jgi:hypothetical protein
MYLPVLVRSSNPHQYARPLGFLYLSSQLLSVFWLNVNKQQGAWKLHKESCRFCKPVESSMKGVNYMKTRGGWFQFESFQDAYEFYQTDHKNLEYWQPCKECNPE